MKGAKVGKKNHFVWLSIGVDEIHLDSFRVQHVLFDIPHMGVNVHCPSLKTSLENASIGLTLDSGKPLRFLS